MRRALAAVLVAAACGDDAPATVDAGTVAVDAAPAPAGDARLDLADAGPCAITLSGALNGTFPCAAMFERRDGEPTTVIGIGGTYGGTVEGISIAARLRGSPIAGDVAESDFDTLVFTASGSGESFTASGGGGPSIGLIGRLTFTSVDARPGGGVTSFVVRGRFSAVLSGAQGHGTVTLSASF